MQQIHKYITAVALAGTLLAGSFAYAATVATPTAAARLAVSIDDITRARNEARGKTQQAKVAARAKIAEVKDKAKQAAATKIVNRLDIVDRLWGDHFTDVVSRLEGALAKIKSRAEKAAANGSDVSAVNAEVVKAEAAIANAKAALAEQAKKTYTVDASSISVNTQTTAGQTGLIGALRAKFVAAKDQMLADYHGLRDGVIKNARTAVQLAAQALVKVPNINEESNTQ